MKFTCSSVHNLTIIDLLFSLCRSFTSATYNKTESGQLAKTLGAHNSKLRRRQTKIDVKTNQLKALQAEAATGTLPGSKKAKMRSIKFEIEQAKLDVQHLKEEIECITEAKERRRKKEEEAKEAHCDSTADLQQENLSETLLENDEELDRAYLLSLAIDANDQDSEVQFQNL